MFEQSISEIDKKILLCELMDSDIKQKQLCDVWFSDPQRDFRLTSGEFVLWQDSLEPMERGQLIERIWQFELEPEHPSLLQLAGDGSAMLFQNNEFYEGRWLLNREYLSVIFKGKLNMELFCAQESDGNISSLAILENNQVKLVPLRESVLAIEPANFMKAFSTKMVATNN